MESTEHFKKAMALIAAVPDDYDLQPLELLGNITVRFDKQSCVVTVFHNYGQNKRTRLFWNPSTGLVDYFYDSFNRRKAFDDFIDESIHMRVAGDASFVKRINRTIDHKDRRNVCARYDRINFLTETGICWDVDPLFQRIEKSNYLERSFRLFHYFDIEATWQKTRSPEMYLAPGESFTFNGVNWFIQRPSVRYAYFTDLRRVPAWLAELLPPPATH